MSLSELLPGDLLLTRSKSGPGWWIRLGAALNDKPNLVNHVIIVHHVDPAGKLWGVEGRPGGVGWVEIGSKILDNPYTMSNVKQPKTLEQRIQVAAGSVALLGTPYNWKAIAGDGFDSAHIPDPWDHLWVEGKPAQVVCSTLADYLYWDAELDSPPHDENCTPGDWAQFIIENHWA